jgi:hypothetical protein
MHKSNKFINHITTNYDEYKKNIDNQLENILQKTNIQKHKSIKQNINVNINEDINRKKQLNNEYENKINSQLEDIMKKTNIQKSQHRIINVVKNKKNKEIINTENKEDKQEKIIDIQEKTYRTIKNIKTINILNIDNKKIIHNNIIQDVNKSNKIIYTKEYLESLFDENKINLIVGRAIMQEWTIIYNFYLLERKTFENKQIFEDNNINIIELEKFYYYDIFDAKTNEEQQEILTKCYENLLEIIKFKTQMKIVLYLINSPVYSPLFQKNILSSIKYNVKLVIWRDDLHSFIEKFNLQNLDINTPNFNSIILNRADLILSPSIKFFKNIKTDYIKKVKYYPYSIDEDVFYNKNYQEKNNNILISGAVNYFVYTKRYEFLRMEQPVFTYLMRPPDRHNFKRYNNIDHRIIDSFGLTGYYKTISDFKGAIMTLANYPLDFILGKFTEVFNTNTLAILDYTHEIDTRLLLDAFDDYVPLILNANNLPINEIEYYNYFINNEYLYNKIVNSGINKMRSYISVKNNTKMLCKIINDLYLEEKLVISNIDTNYFIDCDIDYFNIIILGQLEILLNKIQKINIYCSNSLYKNILELLFENKINFLENNTNTRNITDFIKENIKNNILCLENKYILENNITDFISITNNLKINNTRISCLFTNKQEKELIEKINNINLIKDIQIIYLDINSKDFINNIRQSNLVIIFDEKYSSLLKTFGVNNILLFSYNTKNICNHIYNPFETNEIQVYIQEENNKIYFKEETELFKITFMLFNIYRPNNKFMLVYENVVKNLQTYLVYSEYYYYIGEFGFFNMTLLGKLEEYFNKNNKILYIKTYEDFGKIISSKFGNRVVIENIKLINDREYHDAPTKEINKNKDINLADLLKINYRAIANITTMKEHLKYSSKELELKHENKEYIAIFPRFRQGRFAWRNIDLEMFNNIISNINKTNNRNLEIIIIGNEKEVLQESKEQYKFYGDILEQIYLLNNHIKLLIGPDSGFIDFAKNCKCKNILLLHKFNIDNYHYKFNPFNINFMTSSYVENCDLSSVLKKIL